MIDASTVSCSFCSKRGEARAVREKDGRTLFWCVCGHLFWWKGSE